MPLDICHIIYGIELYENHTKKPHIHYDIKYIIIVQ